MRMTMFLKASLLVLTGALSASGAWAQDGVGLGARVDAEVQSRVVVPAREGDEGPLRFDATPPADQDAYPSRMPVRDERPTSPDAGSPVVYDARTGVETLLPAPVGPFGVNGFVSGRDFGSAVDEMSWGSLVSPPSAVTATVFPWHMHAKMWGTSSGGGYACSGTLVDAKTLFTAGHCVHEGSGGNWMTNLVVSPAWDGDDDYAGSANGIQSGSWTGWTVSGDWAHDQGYVRLDRPVGFLASWQGYGYNDSDAWWSSTTFNLTGWPGGCFAGAPNQLYYAWGTWDSVTANIVGSNLSWPCWAGGMSGGGVYWIDTGSRYVGANVSHGNGKPIETTYIGNCRITGSKFDYMINTFVPDAYSTTVKDLVPLRVLADASVQAGQGIGGMSYLVTNASLYNPIGSSVHPVDVYLSTNDNISEFDTLIESHTFTWNFDAMSQVTVNMGAPVVPGTTTPGTYWTGVILDVADLDINNNDTDGWDAAQITVTPVCNNNASTWFGGVGKPGLFGTPLLATVNEPVVPSSNYALDVSNAHPFLPGYLVLGVSFLNAPFDLGRLYPNPDFLIPITPNGSGNVFLPFPINEDSIFCGLTAWAQVLFPNDSGAVGPKKTSQSRYVGFTFGQ